MNRPAIISKLLIFLLLIIGLSSCSNGVQPDSGTTRHTNYGDVVGFDDAENSHAWFGIPYAKPPVGELRWRASVPPDTWSGTREALEFGSQCTQIGDPMAGTANSSEVGTIIGCEDCLYLNIWAPRFNATNIPQGSDRLPVMFWIHGGGNRAGYGGVDKGHKLASTHNVIVVMINYRLSTFGYFSHPAFRTGASNLDNTANYATSDMILALKWVRDNISYFGGDPNNVTIFGESAGGRNVVSLVVTPEAANLFQKAIVQSGGTGYYTIAKAEHYRDDPKPGHDYSSREVICNLLVADGTAADRNTATAYQDAMSNEQIAAYLRAKTKEEIMNAYKDSSGTYQWPPTIIQDGYLVPIAGIENIINDTSKYNNVPIILGTNRDEAKVFMLMNPVFVDAFQLASGITAEYYNTYSKWASKISKLRGVDDLARWLLSDPKKTNVYAYRFDWDEEGVLLGLVDLTTLLGAAHGIELNFVFGDFDYYHLSAYLYNPLSIGSNCYTRDQLSDDMMSYWAQFAYTGNPATGRPGSDLPPWGAWNTAPNAGKFIVFDTKTGGGIRMSADEVSMDYVRDGISAEPLFSAEAKCGLLRELADVSPDYSETDYPDGPGQLCESFPY
jgi:para-nitrobenzyl esterase